MRKTIPGVLTGALCMLAFDASARFVSVDPVQANPNTGANFNRYYYGNNNPYKFTDPDGREVRMRFEGTVTPLEGRKLMVGVVISPTGEAEVRQLESSKDVYTIHVGSEGPSEYQPETRDVYINVNQDFTIASSGETQDSRLNATHEITHAAEHDRVGDKAFSESLVKPIGADGTKGVSPEENRAVEVEKKVGQELGLPTREHYRDIEPKR